MEYYGKWQKFEGKQQMGTVSKVIFSEICINYTVKNSNFIYCICTRCQWLVQKTPHTLLPCDKTGTAGTMAQLSYPAPHIPC